MARKIIDITPCVTVSPSSGIITDRAAAERLAFEMRDMAVGCFGRQFDVSIAYEDDARCEHCNYVWTEDDHAYNGGCCAKDQANDPVALASLRRLAEEVGAADLYRIDDDGRRGRVSVDWPWALSAAVTSWLDAGRPAEQVPAILEFAERVDSSEWCTVWSDPGVYPSNAGGSPLPDQVSTATEPNELASDVRRLIEAMGLLPVSEAA